MESSTPFAGSADVFAWISGFINLERGQSTRSFRLDRMKLIAELAGNPENCAPSIHMAGSKGKGSITAMAASMLQAAGYRTSRYASPHVADFRERISLGNDFFDEETYRKAGEELGAVINTLLCAQGKESNLFNNKNEDGEEPTFFELMTLWFFLCSRNAGVKAMAVETGMGGRLDATNVLDPLVSVISLIELEHTEYLGNTLGAIAGEKAGIIKYGRPLVLAEQKEEALGVFRQKVIETKSPFYYFPEWGEINNIKLQKEGTFFTLKLKNPRSGKDDIMLKDLKIPIPGEVQANNAGLAILALKTSFQNITGEAIRKGLENFSIPGRFELLSGDPILIIDGAHTPASAEACIRTFTELYGRGAVLIFGCAAGKDSKTMASLFIPCFSRIIITTPGAFKKSSPETVYHDFLLAANEYSKNTNDSPEQKSGKARIVPPEIFFIPQTEKALDTALEFGRELQLPILGAGSFYLASEIRHMLFV